MEKSGRHRNLKSPKSLCFPSVRIPKVVSVNPPGQLQKLIAGCLMETTLIKQYVVKWEKKKTKTLHGSKRILCYPADFACRVEELSNFPSEKVRRGTAARQKARGRHAIMAV